MRADRASNVEPPQKREAHVFSGEKQARKSSGVFAVVPHSGKIFGLVFKTLIFLFVIKTRFYPLVENETKTACAVFFVLLPDPSARVVRLSRDSRQRDLLTGIKG